MSYGDHFTDEPNFNRDGFEEEKTFTPPAVGGFYWVKIPDKIRVQKDGKNLMQARGHYNGIAQIYGRAPFFKMKIWDFAGHATSFGNAPHLIEYGPRIDDPVNPEV